MQIGALSFQPYIYNANYISSNSLNAVSAIPDDPLTSGVDYSELLSDDLNMNPLERGETSNFMDVLQMQFQMSRLNASRLIKPIEANDEILQNQVNEKRFTDTQVSDAQVPSMQVSDAQMPDVQVSDTQVSDAQTQRNLYRMKKASAAYQGQMFA